MNWAMQGESDGFLAALVRRQLTPGLISSLPGMAGLPPFIRFLTSCHKSSKVLTVHMKVAHGKEKVPSYRLGFSSYPIGGCETPHALSFSRFGGKHVYLERAIE